MILADDPVLEDIRFLALESGSSFLSFSPPLSPDEIANFLDIINGTINGQNLSATGKEAYNRVLERISPAANIYFSEKNVSFWMEITSTFEGRAKLNSDISWYPRYPQITPLISIPLSLSFANAVQLYMEPVFAKNSAAFNKDFFDLNLPIEYNQLNHDFLTRAFLAAGGDWWNLQIGRDRLYWGTSRTGSLTFSDNSPHFDFARLSFFSSTIKYSVIVNQLPLKLTDKLFPDPQESAYPSGWNEIENFQHVLQRYFYLHRLDFRFFNKVSIGLMEGMMAGNSPFEIRFLNPMIIFHSLFAWKDFPKWPANNGDIIGSFASVEVNWNIINKLAIYGQFAMNELTLPGESDGHPSGLGYLLGIQFAYSFNNWGKISWLEFICTDPYLSILSTPFASFIQMDRFENYYFLGYPRDTIALSLGTNFFRRNELNFSGSFSWISSGQHNNNSLTNGLTWDWEKGTNAIGKSPPSGTVENKFILALSAGWKPFPWFIFSASIAGIVSHNNNHISDNNQIGAQTSFSAGFRY